jgi:alkylhydroperoxidase family enzyme
MHSSRCCCTSPRLHSSQFEVMHLASDPAVPVVKAVFDDIRATRKSDFVNNFWRALAHQPGLLERTWASVKQVMIEPGVLDPLTKELVYSGIYGQQLQLLRPFAHRRGMRQGASPISSMLSSWRSLAWQRKRIAWPIHCKSR